MLIEAGDPVTVPEQDTAAVRFGAEPLPGGGVGRRLLWLEEDPAFELSFWCGTCALLFRRLEGARSTVSLSALADRLTTGLDRIDPEVVDRFTAVLAADVYRPLLFELSPALVAPGRPGDYFSEEQVATWGLSPFWGLPEYPATPYYRAGPPTRLSPTARLFEFVVPMVPPFWNTRARVDELVARLTGPPGGSSVPTAVAVSVLDVCQPATAGSADYEAHWGLVHFLLDGHHKLEAAVTSGRPVRLLSLLATGASLASPADLQRLVDVLGARSGVGDPAG
ncbi:hypothetical protein FHX74_002607 [Friedmanniella endophytica]|uniref:Uncharacterized protein n=1 Tax=Microlunatus kandeliicorticis TaxID=1759536 RepID=A0A7W3ITI0_9ACTN|nr:hypothetical protein [Microlunatus kandeliicorticis]MBA8794979.1 hypothetical protein [Microlunatus kandeliicorticis]